MILKLIFVIGVLISILLMLRVYFSYFSFIGLLYSISFDIIDVLHTHTFDIACTLNSHFFEVVNIPDF